MPEAQFASMVQVVLLVKRGDSQIMKQPGGGEAEETSVNGSSPAWMLKRLLDFHHFSTHLLLRHLDFAISLPPAFPGTSGRPLSHELPTAHRYASAA